MPRYERFYFWYYRQIHRVKNVQIQYIYAFGGSRKNTLADINAKRRAKSNWQGNSETTSGLLCSELPVIVWIVTMKCVLACVCVYLSAANLAHPIRLIFACARLCIIYVCLRTSHGCGASQQRMQVISSDSLSLTTMQGHHAGFFFCCFFAGIFTLKFFGARTTSPLHSASLMHTRWTHISLPCTPCSPHAPRRTWRRSALFWVHSGLGNNKWLMNRVLLDTDIGCTIFHCDCLIIL